MPTGRPGQVKTGNLCVIALAVAEVKPAVVAPKQ